MGCVLAGVFFFAFADLQSFGVEPTEEMDSFERSCLFGIVYARRGLFREFIEILSVPSLLVAGIQPIEPKILIP